MQNLFAKWHRSWRVLSARKKELANEPRIELPLLVPEPKPPLPHGHGSERWPRVGTVETAAFHREAHRILAARLAKATIESFDLARILSEGSMRRVNEGRYVHPPGEPLAHDLALYLKKYNQMATVIALGTDPYHGLDGPYPSSLRYGPAGTRLITPLGMAEMHAVINGAQAKVEECARHRRAVTSLFRSKTGTPVAG